MSARVDLVDAARRLDQLGLNVNSSGNLSVRLVSDDGLDTVLVTPSGVPAAELRPEHLVVLDSDGTVRPGQLAATSEWRLHVALYAARPELAAIVHTHSPEATAASTLGRPLPAVHYVIARFGTGDRVRCAPYATYGTQELADAVVTTLAPSGTACLMANHGALAAGRDLAEAMALALDIEWLCGVHRRAVAQGTPGALAADEIDHVAAKFASYGQAGPEWELEP